jgi:hypothetical protein
MLLEGTNSDLGAKLLLTEGSSHHAKFRRMTGAPAANFATVLRASFESSRPTLLISIGQQPYGERFTWSNRPNVPLQRSTA